MNNDQYIRYKTLDRCFRNVNGTYTIDDLVDECCKAVAAYHGNLDFRVSRRTVEQDLEDLQLRYDIKLVKGLKYGRKRVYKYEDCSYSLMTDLLADGEKEKQMLQNVLDQLQRYEDVPQYKWLYILIQNILAGKNDDINPIVFQNNPDLLGMENFGTLLDAILRKRTITIGYKPHQKEETQHIVHPYMLRQYNDRWFMIGHRQDTDKALTTFAIDRITNVAYSNIEYVESSINLDEYYEDVIGVSRYEDAEPEEVIIRVGRHRYPYIMSKPLHESQKEIKSLRTEDTYTIRIKVHINRELESLLFSFGNDIEVLSPDSLRAQMKAKIDDLMHKYSTTQMDCGGE